MRKFQEHYVSFYLFQAQRQWWFKQFLATWNQSTISIHGNYRWEVSKACFRGSWRSCAQPWGSGWDSQHLCTVYWRCTVTLLKTFVSIDSACLWNFFDLGRIMYCFRRNVCFSTGHWKFLLFLGNQGENRQLFIANLPLNASKELTCVCLRCKSPKLTVCDNMKIFLFLAWLTRPYSVAFLGKAEI